MDAIAPAKIQRLQTTINELDRVLGGGIAPSMTVLVGGNPGIGKSTLMMQLAGAIGANALYVSSEETAQQLKMRAERLSLKHMDFGVVCSVNVEEIVGILHNVKPKVVIVDSVQMIRSLEYDNPSGSTTQLRICCQECIDWVHQNSAALFLVAHVTKEGIISGPKFIEHLVDAVLYFEESDEQFRYLRAVKNRFGNVHEIGIFQMEDSGLIPIADPNSVLVTNSAERKAAGVVTVPIYEGSRVLLVEIQALTTPTSSGISRVYSDKIDPRRIAKIAAVLEQHIKIPLSNNDIYINIAGGIRVQEVGIELAIAHALYSAYKSKPLPAQTIVAGEVSLTGELKPIQQLKRRINTAYDLGYRHCIAPKQIYHREKIQSKWIKCTTVKESIERMLTIIPNTP